MKSNSTLFLLKKFSLYSSLALLGIIAQSCSVNESINGGEAKNARSSKKEKDVKIYPDVWKRMMHVKNVNEERVDFFVFDSEVTILVHYKMGEKDHKRINGLEKGTYTYQVFKNDEMSESGRIIIK